MALQWMILTYVLAAEAAIALLLTIPCPKFLKKNLVSSVSLLLQPTLFVVPFAGFQLLGNPPSLFSLRFNISWLFNSLDACDIFEIQELVI